METIVQNIYNIGADDPGLELFESQYAIHNGMSYNSYLILDEKTAVLDTVDIDVTEKWMENLLEGLKGRTLDYLIVQHMESDHSGSIGILLEHFPNLTVVGNTLTFTMLRQFFPQMREPSKQLVKDGDSLSLGKHHLHFYTAPMIHWPEVMMTYEEENKILFSADAFGRFGTKDAPIDWLDEGRRYYVNICGKFGMQVQSLLKKVENLPVEKICSLHGPVLSENLKYYMEKYSLWSRYEPEESGILIAHASIHGNTKAAAEYMKEVLESADCGPVRIMDLCREDIHEAVAQAFRYDKMILAASSYNGEVFPPMEIFLSCLKSRGLQKRKVALIENGTWAPSAGRVMKTVLNDMKEMEVEEPVITVRSVLKQEQKEQMKQLAERWVKEK